MRSLGYQVLKSRGISFIDNKKVKIKGSDVGFSLMKIEKIFALKHEIEAVQQIERNRKETEVQQQNKSLTKFFNTDLSPATELQKQLNDLIYQIMKPEDIPDRLAPEWLKKKRQKKRLGHHL